MHCCSELLQPMVIARGKGRLRAGLFMGRLRVAGYS